MDEAPLDAACPEHRPPIEEIPVTRITHDPRANNRPDLAAHLNDLHAALIEQRRFRADQLAELTKAPHSVEDDDALEQVTVALQVGASTALADIGAALGRIKNGQYGRCERCDDAISLERLEILPAAALCMPCQQRAERSAEG
jgi:DnaK suppressor protein